MSGRSYYPAKLLQIRPRAYTLYLQHHSKTQRPTINFNEVTAKVSIPNSRPYELLALVRPSAN